MSLRKSIKRARVNANSYELVIQTHIRELTYRGVYLLWGWFLRIFTLVMYRDLWLYTLLTPLGDKGVFLSLTAIFNRGLQLAVVVRTLSIIPLMYLHLWAFAAPSLHKSEQLTLFGLMGLSLLRGIVAFSLWWLIFLPLVCQFFLSWHHGRVLSLTYLPEVTAYLDLSLGRLIGLGFMFQLPPFITLGVFMKWWSPILLMKGRRFAYLLLLLVATLLSPPDVGSQLILAVPLCLAYECAVFLRLCLKTRSLQQQHVINFFMS